MQFACGSLLFLPVRGVTSPGTCEASEPFAVSVFVDYRREEAR